MENVTRHRIENELGRRGYQVVPGTWTSCLDKVYYVKALDEGLNNCLLQMEEAGVHGSWLVKTLYVENYQILEV